MLTAIAAVSQSWGIGKNGDLLFNIPEDKKFFRKTTLNHTVVMGRKTLESLPGGKPFKDRRNIILSRNSDFSVKEAATIAMGVPLSEAATTAMGVPLSETAATVCHSIDEILPVIDSDSEEIFIAGGGEIYKAMLPHCQRAIITKVSGNPDADTFFPNLDEDSEWVLESESEEQEFEGLKFRFCTYKKIENKTR